tara:strand:- start:271 stop:1059 length:789 start_codon:yes stop_codon:yes gene_type:complete
MSKRDITFPTKYDKTLLIPIDRIRERQNLNIEWNENTFYGKDQWTCYEFSWLNLKGKPINKILYISYPSNTPFFVESKSLKLYLFSLNNEKFSSEDEIVQLIKNDLEELIQGPLTLELTNNAKILSPDFHSIDSLHVNIPKSVDVDSRFLKIRDKEVSAELKTSLFRSLCPVTSQPDWADIFIKYEGKEVDEESLLSYLISYRNHQAFHEQCVEKIFIDLLSVCELSSLVIQANFLRRGGIEINPIRSTINSELGFIRTTRQ